LIWDQGLFIKIFFVSVIQFACFCCFWIIIKLNLKLTERENKNVGILWWRWITTKILIIAPKWIFVRIISQNRKIFIISLKKIIFFPIFYKYSEIKFSNKKSEFFSKFVSRFFKKNLTFFILKICFFFVFWKLNSRIF